MSSVMSIGQKIDGKIAEAGGIGAVASIGFKGYTGISTYNRARREGEGVLSSGLKGASRMVIADVVGGKHLMAARAMRSIPSAGISTYYSIDQQRRQMGRMGSDLPFQNANFIDTQQAYTMRQAGMKMAEKSQFNTQRAMLGNEAQYIG